jgi:xylulokinase
MSLLGLDIGTSGCKAVVFNEEGKELSRGYKEYRLLFPDAEKCELDPHEVWDAICSVVSTAAAEVRGRDPVNAMGISALADAVTPLDMEGRFLSNTVVGSSDRRAISQAGWIENTIGRKKIFQSTGVPVHSMYSVPKIMWFQKNQPEIYRNTWKFAGWPEIVQLKLGLDPKTDLSMASRSMGLNIKTEDWDLQLMNTYGIDREKLFPLTKSYKIVGNLKDTIHTVPGVEKNTAVAAGGFDQCCAAVGVGLTCPGIGALTLGTCGVVTAISDRCVLHDSLLEGNHGLNIFVLDERYASFGIIVTAGSVLRWYREGFCTKEIADALHEKKDPYEYMINSSPDTPSSVFVLPYFAGTGTPWFDPNQKGSIFGLTLNTSRLEILKGILDCICYELKLNIESMKSAGLPIESLRAIGGGAKSEKWMQLIADVVELPVEVTGVNEAGCLGAAFLSGLGRGIYSSQKDIAEIVKIEKVFEPRKSISTQYESPYQTYKELTLRVRGLRV